MAVIAWYADGTIGFVCSWFSTGTVLFILPTILSFLID